MVNATEMAKPFGKRPVKWLELPSTKEFLFALTEVRKSDSGLVQTDKGGVNGGCTWMHEDVALEFARWLSPAFAIWCNDRIKELLKNGTTAVQQNTSHQITLREQMSWVKEVKKLLNLNDASTLELLQKVAAPLGLPLPNYTPSRGILKSASELLKESGSTMSAQAFNARLVEQGYLTELSRPSSNGGVKKFKSITAKGLEYGENQVNPNNPKSTQPLWYADRFNEFMNVVK